MALSPFQYRSPHRRATPTLAAKLASGTSSWRETFIAAELDHELVETEITRRPLYLWLTGILAIGAVFLLQLFNLQVVQGERYAGLADGNRLRQSITYAQRGNIYDRYGVELATNVPSFQLVVRPHLLPQDTSARQRVYEEVARLAGVTAGEIKAKAEVSDHNPVEPLVVKDRLNRELALAFEERLPQLPGFVVDAIPVRSYKGDNGLAHSLGYTGRVAEAELAAHPALLPVDFIGKDGVELQYDEHLRGINGVTDTEVDAYGDPVRVLRQRAAANGDDLTLSLDYKLQQQFASAIRAQMKEAGVVRAAGVAIDPNTGEVLASVSLPSYDNNLFARGIKQDTYQQLIDDPLEPLHNKVIGGGYPSGSIIKPMHLAGALQEGVVDENTVIVDRGQLVLRSPYDPSATFTFRGWQPGGLGPMDARSAVAMSSDIYFYTTGGGYGDFKGLGVDRLAHYYRLYGLGNPTGIDLPGEAGGRIPTPQWLETNYGRPWSVGDTYNISIGQGDLLASPLQMAMATAAVANGGKLIEPTVVKQDGAARPKIIRQDFVDERHIKVAREGMLKVIGGTTCSCTFANVPARVAGKSGTAETDPNDKTRKPHAWYTAFAPYDNPEILMVVLLEEGEGGSQYAAPAIARTMEWYFKHR